MLEGRHSWANDCIGRYDLITSVMVNLLVQSIQSIGASQTGKKRFCLQPNNIKHQPPTSSTAFGSFV